jgi:hypothetical protein
VSKIDFVQNRVASVPAPRRRTAEEKAKQEKSAFNKFGIKVSDPGVVNLPVNIARMRVVMAEDQAAKDDAEATRQEKRARSAAKAEDKARRRREALAAIPPEEKWVAALMAQLGRVASPTDYKKVTVNVLKGLIAQHPALSSRKRLGATTWKRADYINFIFAHKLPQYYNHENVARPLEGLNVDSVVEGLVADESAGANQPSSEALKAADMEDDGEDGDEDGEEHAELDDLEMSDAEDNGDQEGEELLLQFQRGLLGGYGYDAEEYDDDDGAAADDDDGAAADDGDDDDDDGDDDQGEQDMWRL